MERLYILAINASASAREPRHGPGRSCLSVVIAAAHLHATSGGAVKRLPTYVEKHVSPRPVRPANVRGVNGA